MNDVSGFGIIVTISASISFPQGFILTQYSDDADALDVPNITITETAMGVNGDLISYSKANPIKSTLNVIPDSNDDINLGILFENNRAGRGKQPIRDILTMVIIYPNGRTTTLLEGVITDGMPSSGVAGSGRKKTKQYMFAFENRVST